MSSRGEHAAIVGVGVAACAVCCAGPIAGVLAAIGLGTVGAAAIFGAVALLIGAAVAVAVVVRRRRRVVACAVDAPASPVTVDLGETHRGG